MISTGDTILAKRSKAWPYYLSCQFTISSMAMAKQTSRLL